MDIAPGQKWRHYKSKGGLDHVYEIIGIAKHSETEDILVIYKLLYDASSNRLGNYDFVARPLSMWSDIVKRNGVEVKRFSLIH